MEKHRNNGAIGAILDEYEKAINELIREIKNFSPNQLIEIIDRETNDEDCKSVQGILTHIVQSGYTYVVEIRIWLGEEITYKDKVVHNSTEKYAEALRTMFQFNAQLFEDYPNLVLCEHDSTKKIKVRWGQTYDVDQLIEHAIMHVHRHRRQIERFKLKMIP
ncbi:MAG: putative damage-inducible protein DinB [Crocinitomix sp.]|jgi:uncharacterized damage-inducible protein DinB